MSSQVEICNRALNLLATKTITALSDNTQEAIRCNLIYNTARDGVLRDHPWGFARASGTLAILSDETVNGWDYLYVYPTKCLKILNLFEDSDNRNADGIEWKEYMSPTTKQRSIATDISPAYVEYIYQVTDTTQYDQKFVEALSFKLASELAKPLTGNMDAGIKFMQMYSAIISDAKKHDSEESNFKESRDSSYLTARE